MRFLAIRTSAPSTTASDHHTGPGSGLARLLGDSIGLNGPLGGGRGPELKLAISAICLPGGGFSDFFNAIFGMSAQAQQMRGRDMEQPVAISLVEAYSGTTRTFKLNGRKLEISIPPGSKTGTRVRVSGKGEQSRGQPGDLYLKVRVQKMPGIERKGDDIYVEVETDLYAAILGDEVELSTLGGPVMLKIPAGSQPGRTFRLRGRGMPKLSDPSQHGDLLASLKLTLPKKLSKEERKLFEQLAKLRKS